MVQQANLGGIGPAASATLDAGNPTADFVLHCEITMRNGVVLAPTSYAFVYAETLDNPFTIEWDFTDDSGVSFSRTGKAREVIYFCQPRVFVVPVFGQRMRVRARRIPPDGSLFGDAHVVVTASIR